MLFEVRNYLENLERKLQETKHKKVSNLSKNTEIKKLALARFKEHLSHFKFKVDFTYFSDNTHNILTLNESNGSKNEHDDFIQASRNNITELTKNIQNNAENKIRTSSEDSSSDEVEKVPKESENVAMFRGNRLEGKFVSKNVTNCSRRNLSSAEISLLFPKFVYERFQNKRRFKYKETGISTY